MIGGFYGIGRGAALCTTVGLLLATPLRAQPAPEQTMRRGQAVVLLTRSCQGSAIESAALLAAAAGFAAEALVGWIGGKLEERKAGLTGQFVAGGVIESDPTNAACLRIYRGPIGAGGIPTNASAADTADFLLDADVKVDNGIWTVTPYRLVYRNSAARTKSSTKHVSVVIALTESRPADPAKVEADKPLAVFRHDFGELKLRSTYSGGTLAGTAAASPMAAHKALNVTALVTESSEPGPALTALIGAFTKSKDKLTESLTTTIKDAIGGKE